MIRDPAAYLKTRRIVQPPSSGPGSGKEAWVSFAEAVALANLTAWDLVEAQSNLIASLEAEVAHLQAQLAAVRNGVSSMTVPRLTRAETPDPRHDGEWNGGAADRQGDAAQRS